MTTYVIFSVWPRGPQRLNFTWTAVGMWLQVKRAEGRVKALIVKDLQVLGSRLALSWYFQMSPGDPTLSSVGSRSPNY